MIGLVISIGINLVNSVLKFLLIKIIVIQKHDTKSDQMNGIKVGVFFTQFFNTGLLILLSNMNQIESSIPFMKQIFKGPYTDFNS